MTDFNKALSNLEMELKQFQVLYNKEKGNLGSKAEKQEAKMMQISALLEKVNALKGEEVETASSDDANSLEEILKQEFAALGKRFETLKAQLEGNKALNELSNPKKS